MTKIKRLVAVTVAILMILGSISIAASAWDANTNDSMNVSFTTKVFRQVNGAWIETTKVEPGETVKARVYVNTEYYTHTGNLLMFYNTEFFTDSYAATGALAVGSFYQASPYGITGTYFSSASTSSVEAIQVAGGNITQAYADTHNYFQAFYEFGEPIVQKLNGSQWLCEFDLNVINSVDTTDTGVLEIVPGTILSPTNTDGIINIPKGQYNTLGMLVTDMSVWTAVPTITDASVVPFTSLTTLTFNANGGTFSGYAGSTYITEGDLGDAVSAPPPAVTRDGYNFIGWIDASDATPTAGETVSTPATFSNTITYDAFWEEINVADNDLNIETEFFRLDSVSGTWVATDRVARGEQVKARIYLDTTYPTGNGQFMLFYDKDFFSAGFGSGMINIGATGTAFNTTAGTDAADAGYSGEIITNAASNIAANDLINNGLVAQSVFDDNNYMLVTFRAGNNEVCRLLDSASQSEYFIELTFNVLNTATATGDLFTLVDTFTSPATPATVRYGYSTVDKYATGTVTGSGLSMSYWDADITLASNPVSLDSTITLNANGGEFASLPTTTTVQAFTGYIGATFDQTAIPAISMANSTFMGWAPAALPAIEANIVSLPATFPYEDAEYNAVWNTEVNITYDYNYADAADAVPDTVIVATANTPFAAVADPTRTGYYFVGWSTDGSTPDGLPAVYPGVDTVYYPVWAPETYVLTYYALDPETQSFITASVNDVDYGTVIPTTVPNFDHYGYTISAPYTNVGLTTLLPPGATMPASNYNVYYRLTAGSWPVTYEANGGYFNGDPLDTQEVISAVYGQQIPTPADPVRPYYEFAGWVPSVGIMDAESKTFTASWTAVEYTANYYVDDVLIQTYAIEFGDSVDVPMDPDDPTGYTFVGWAPRGTTTVVDFVTDYAAGMPATTLEFDAIFEANNQTIIFDATPGYFNSDPLDTTEVVVAPYDSTLVLPTAPVLPGYDFVGWSNDGGLTEISDPYIVTGDETFTAMWEIHTWTVTYVVDAANYEVFNDVAYGALIPAVTVEPTKDGYDFIGWTPGYDPFATMPDNDVTYTAVFDVREYSFTLNAGSGVFADSSSVTTITQDFGTAITYPANPTYVGYDFLGWVPAGTVNPTTANLVIPLPATMGVNPISYDALWAARSDTPYTVNIYKMDTAGVYPAVPDTVLNLTGVTDTVATYTPVDLQWFYVSTTAPYASVLSGTVTADGSLVLSVYFAREEWTITFDGNGGLIAGNPTVVTNYFNGANVVAPADPVLTGWVFTGWSPTVDSIASEDATYTAQWTRDSYTITYYDFDSSVVATDTYLFEDAVALTAVVPTRAGYTFENWYESLAVGSLVFAPPATMPAADLVAYAKYTVNQYDATFSAPDADPAYADVVVPVNYGEAITPPATDPTRTGYTFAGWSTDGVNAVTDFGTMPIGGTDYVALWTADEGSYTVNIFRMASDGNYPASPTTTTNYTSPTVYTGDTVTLASGVHYSVPAGRFLDYTAPYVTTLSGTIPTTGELVLNVYIGLNLRNLTVVVDSNVRQEALRVTAPTGITDPTPPTGYTFAGWVDAAGNAAVAPPSMPNNDVFLRATWAIINSDITYNLGGGNVAGDTSDIVQSYDYGAIITNVPVPVREGYTFTGWSPAVPVLMPETDVNVVAQWTINQYNATFSAPLADNPAYPDVVTAYDFGEAITAPATDPDRVGYTFGGWSADGVNVVTDFGNMSTAGATFVALWEPMTNTVFTVRVNYFNNVTGVDTTADNGFTGTTADNAVIVNALPDPLVANTRYVLFSEITPITGYELDTADPRNTAPSAIIAADGSTIINLYYVAQSRTVTFDAGTGGQYADATTSKTTTQPYGTFIPAPAEYPTRTGYTLNSWNPAFTPGTIRLFNNRTFTAQWTVNQYNATFTAPNASPVYAPVVIAFDYGAAITPPAVDPTRTGYTFAGWSIDGVNEVTDFGTMTEAGATFTALWDANPHTITFYAADNATVYGVENVLYGDSVTSNVPPIPPTLVGNIFNGWNTAADGTGNTPAFYASMPDTDLVFYPTYVGESSVSYRLETFDMDTNGNYPATPTSVANFTDGVVGQTRTINPNYTRIGFTPDLGNSTLSGIIAAGEPLVLQLYYARNQYDVTTYTADGATLLNTYTAYYNGFSPAIADAPAIDGYEFTQWDDAAGAGGNVVTLPFIVGTSDVNLYANYSVLSFDAVFEAPAADVPYQEVISVVFGDTITAPATVPVREGWTFNGWAADGSSVVITDFGTMTSAGAVFHAIWTRTGYTVTFLFNDRNAATGALEAATTEISSTVTTFGDPIAFPTAPTLSYYVFDGWFEGGVTQWAAGATMPAHDLVLVARYERVQVMLIPIAGSTTKIDRSDLVSANDINATTYRSQPVDTEWYIYGLERQTNFDDADLLASYIQVQGDGVISFTPILNQGVRQYGTGTLVTVTDRVTGDVVEEFIIVVYGDVTGDTRSDAADIAIIRQESMMASSWSVVGSPTYRKCLVMAADFSKDNKITVTDFAAIKDVVARIKDINQETGTTYLI